ncbi:TfoX/Sxy family DNA transformation protein [bacterium]|nr:TfoX/Sxy family DNA transformation protein [bacterium]
MKERITRSQSLKQLQTLRNIGVATARRLHSIGIRTPEQLKQSDPEKVYEMLRKEEERLLSYRLHELNIFSS